MTRWLYMDDTEVSTEVNHTLGKTWKQIEQEYHCNFTHKTVGDVTIIRLTFNKEEDLRKYLTDELTEIGQLRYINNVIATQVRVLR